MDTGRDLGAAGLVILDDPAEPGADRSVVTVLDDVFDDDRREYEQRVLREVYGDNHGPVFE